MPSTQQLPTTDDAAGLDTQDNAAKLEAVNELLGIPPEETAKPERESPETESEKSLSEALAEAEKPPDSGESREAITPPKTLSELSEMTGISVDDLYAMEIPAAEDSGENPTLGTLKDHAAKQIDFAGRELEFEERKVTFGNEQAKARQELEIVLAALPEGAIKPDVLAKARKEREVMLDREAVRLLDVIPEWESDDTKRTELSAIGEHMTQYGFDESYVDSVADHRMLRYMRDNFKRKTLVEKALAGVKKITTVPKGNGQKPTTKREQPTVTPDSTQDEQLAAIDTLLNQD